MELTRKEDKSGRFLKGFFLQSFFCQCHWSYSESFLKFNTHMNTKALQNNCVMREKISKM